MRSALDAAQLAATAGDVPVGAVVLSPDGVPLGTGWNERELRQDPTAHAEVLAIQEAAATLGHWRLTGCTLVVTLEPCAMCAGAILAARFARLVLGTWDPKAGAAGSLWDVVRDPRTNHQVEVVSGLEADQCSGLLKDFFAARRS